MIKDIPGYEGLYTIDEDGGIKNVGDKSLTWTYGDRGYASITLTKDRTKKIFRVHRLVAIAFIENPDEKPQVDHIDENKANNCVYNLRWCTNKENSTWFYENNPDKVSRTTAPMPVTVNGQTYHSAYAAAKFIHLASKRSNIHNIAKEIKRRHISQGAIWLMYGDYLIGG